MRTIIENGTIVLPERTIQGSIAVEGEKIAEISDGKKLGGDKFINAGNNLVLPGGIDPHVHLHLSMGKSLYSADNFKSGSISALCGGTTSLIDFITPGPGQSLCAAAEMRLKEAENSRCDYLLHASVVKGMSNIKQQLKDCKKNFGITSCKIYMAYQDTIGLNDSEALEVFHAASELDIRVLVHCEWGEMIDFLKARALEDKYLLPQFHPLTRPAYTEQFAVAKAVKMAEECAAKVYVVHISTSEGMGEVIKAKHRGIDIKAEVCLHHLLFNDLKFSPGNKDAAQYIMSPPLRAPSEQKALWEYVKTGIADTIATDHCPFSFKQKDSAADFTQIPKGVNGIRERMELFYSESVNKHGIPAQLYSSLTAGNAADIFELGDRKGRIKEGADADLIIFNPDEKYIVPDKSSGSLADFNVYKEIPGHGKIQTVIRRGEAVLVNGEIQPNTSAGRYLRD